MAIGGSNAFFLINYKDPELVGKIILQMIKNED